jgi:hypothetical protein
MIGFVDIKDGSYRGTPVSGTFEARGMWVPHPRNGKGGYVYVMIDGKQRGVGCDFADVTFHKTATESVVENFVDTKQTKEDMEAEISKRFRVMDTILNGVIAGDIPSTIISGAPGCGKSYTVEEKLAQAQAEGIVSKVRHIKGKMSAVVLYSELYACSGKGEVLVMDDCDSVFECQDSMNILKAALDSGAKRTVYWNTASSYLEEMGVPQNFDFRGSAIFLTNKDFNREIDKSSKMSPHFKALVSRCGYLDTKVHTPEQIMIRVKQVIRDTDILENLGLDETKSDEAIAWIETNVNRMREISLRTINKLAGYMKTNPTDWQDLAEVMMLR